MNLQPDLLRVQPKRFPTQQVQVDFRKLLSSMGQALTHGTFAFLAPEPVTAAGSAVNAGAAIFGAVEALEADAPLEVRAWYLLRNALANALAQLLGELHERVARSKATSSTSTIASTSSWRATALSSIETSSITPARSSSCRRSAACWRIGSRPRLASARAMLDRWQFVSIATSRRRSVPNHVRTAISTGRFYDHFEDRFAFAAEMEWDWERTNRLARASHAGWTHMIFAASARRRRRRSGVAPSCSSSRTASARRRRPQRSTSSGRRQRLAQALPPTGRGRPPRWASGVQARGPGSAHRRSGPTAPPLDRRKTPDQLELPFALSTSRAVRELIERRFSQRLGLSTVQLYVKR